MSKWKKTISAVSASLVISGGLLSTSVVDASSLIKKIEAHYQNIKIVNNGLTVTIDPKTEPFIYNGTTYIPLRMMGELYNKNVQWNGPANTITITDKTPAISPTVVTALNNQIAQKNAKIAQLEADLNKLRAEEDKNTKSTDDIYDLEDELNDDYEDHKDIDDIEIFLSGDEEDITVRINVNSSDWDDLSTSKKEAFLQDIVDDILDEFDDAEIEGTVKDEKNNKLLTSFEIDSDGDVEIEDEGTDLDDFAEELTDDFDGHDDIDDIEIFLDGDEDDIDLTVEVNEEDWSALSTTKKRNFLQDVVDDILREYRDAFIDGVVKDEFGRDTLDTFEADGEDEGEVEIDD